MCVLQGTLYLQIEYGQATGSALPRRNSICGKQSAAEYTQEPARCKLVCNCNGFSQMCVLQGTLISPNKIRQARGVLCRGATVYAASRAQPNIRGSLRSANLFAIAMASRRCVCCKAHLYLQIGYGQSRGSAMPRRYSICGKQSAAEYTRKPALCKLVCNCNGFSQMCVLQGTLISPNEIRQARGVLCRGATVYAASIAQPNIRRDSGI